MISEQLRWLAAPCKSLGQVARSKWRSASGEGELETTARPAVSQHRAQWSREPPTASEVASTAGKLHRAQARGPAGCEGTRRHVAG